MSPSLIVMATALDEVIFVLMHISGDVLVLASLFILGSTHLFCCHPLHCARTLQIVVQKDTCNDCYGHCNVALDNWFIFLSLFYETEKEGN